MSPVRIKKVNGFRVSTPGGVKAKNTTKKKALAQKRLLNAIEHGWKPTQSHSEHLAERMTE